MLKDKLFNICSDFIRDNEIFSDECILQNDEIQSNLPELIISICELIGYCEYVEMDE